MNRLFQKVRRQTPQAQWSHAEDLVRTGMVAALLAEQGEARHEIDTNGDGVVAIVKLQLQEREWQCSCESSDFACLHVAAAVIAERRIQRPKRRRPDRSKPGHVRHRLERAEGMLALRRVLVKGRKEIPLEGSLDQVPAGDDAKPEFIITPQDHAVEAIVGLEPGPIPERLMVRCLEALQEVSDLVYAGKPAHIGRPSQGLCIRVEDCRRGFRARLDQDPLVNEVFQNGALRRGIKILAVVPHSFPERLFTELRAGRIYAKDEVGTLVGEVIPSLERQLPVHIKTKKLPKRQALRPRLQITTSEEPGDRLGLHAVIVYGNPPRARVEDGRLVLVSGSATPVRDQTVERRLTQDLATTLELLPEHKSVFSEDKAIAFAVRLMHSPPEEVTIIGDAHQRFFDVGDLEAKFEVKDDGNVDLWFEPTGGTGDSGGSNRGHGRGVDAAVMLRAWQDGSSMVPLLNGGFGRLPADWLARFGHRVRDFISARETLDKNGTEAPKAMTVALSASLLKALEQPLPPEFKRLRGIVDEFAGIPKARIPQIGGTLRDYQRTGVDWLCFLRSAELGALLADDMGLGKTLQTLCAIKGRTLVVAPTSVLHNWKAELARFRPQLRVAVYHGLGRELSERADVTLSTYALLRIDAEKLAAEKWDMVVLDESQAIKNPTSQVTRAAYGLNAKFKVALTGTPVENRLEDLWSQFHFVNPGLLGGRQDFYDRYTKPINAGDPDAAARLRERIRPFVLRRMKSEVAKELPPRTEVVLHCQLTADEREIYDTVRAATKAEVAKKLASAGGTLAVLEALLRLRQASCHSGLIPGQSERKEGSSSKLDLLRETLEEALSEGHKALVFSQWTSLLDLTGDQLDAAKIDYVRLDGSTTDRGAVVDAFQDENGPKVMLISLKAGGTGLNLTAADHVFLLDPWWNPAVEDQAADRAHRIGQTRPVLVHRLVAADTVEERIIALQAKKRELAEAAVGKATGGSEITKGELLALLD